MLFVAGEADIEVAKSLTFFSTAATNKFGSVSYVLTQFKTLNWWFVCAYPAQGEAKNGNRKIKKPTI